MDSAEQATEKNGVSIKTKEEIGEDCTKMSGLIKVITFNGENEDFELFSERLQHYFIANDIKSEGPRRAAILLTSIDERTYKLLQDLCFPESLAEKSYEELVKLLLEHTKKETSIFTERYKFHKAKQEADESVQEWAARLKRLASSCFFKETLEMMLRDRFIVGINNVETLNRLFRESDALTFNRAVEIARQIEVAKRHTKEVKPEYFQGAVKVNAIHGATDKPRGQLDRARSSTYPKGGGRPGKERKERNQEKLKCYACGKDSHLFKDCRYKAFVCKNCGKTGHLAIVCKKGATKDSKSYYCTAENETQVKNFNLNVVNKEPILVKVKVGGVPLTMEVDSGSGVSVISLETFKNYFKAIRLEKSNIVLVSYNQTRDKPIGYFCPVICHGDESVKSNIYVVKNGGPSLFGRDLLKSFGMGIAKVNKITVDMGENIKMKYTKLFSEGLGKYKYGVVNLKLKENSKPIFCKPRPLPFAFREEVSKELDRLEKEGMIAPIEHSEWGTPLVPVLKKDGKIRLCADYKVTLNRSLEEVKYPLPKIDEIFAKLSGGEEFTKLDLSEAYSQLCLDEESSKLATWSTHKGLFKVNRLPYGVSPAAAKFQRMLEQLLLGLTGVVNFLDDIVVTGSNRQEHVQRLEIVLNKLQEAGLKLGSHKCEFFKKEIVYLGFTISKEGLKKNKAKVDEILLIERPTTVKETRSFLGMVGYYNRFIPSIATVLGPLYKLLKKNEPFVWSQECEAAFVHIKKLLTSEEVLAHYDPDRQIKLICDSSSEGIGAVLVHVFDGDIERPIAYTARVLTQAERNYSMVEKEALAIVHAVKQYHQYLYGRTFVLATDHKPLISIFGENKGIPLMAASRLQRWAVLLSGYNYKIEYIQGRNNVMADFLSRIKKVEVKIDSSKSVGNYLNFIESQYDTIIDSRLIARETDSDEDLSIVKDYIIKGWPEKSTEKMKPYFIKKGELTVDKDCVLWGYRVVIPSKLRTRILEELHVTHMGIVKTKGIARSLAWWPGMDEGIEKLIKGCEACALNRPEPAKAAVIEWQKPPSVWHRVHIDYLGPVLGRMYLIAIDAFSKWPEVVQVSKANAEETVHRLREMFARFGIPQEVVSDNGTTFTAEVCKCFLRKNGIKQIFIPPGHPASNGQAENGVKSFKNGLYKALIDENNKGVPVQTLVSRYLLGYRTAPHCTTKKSPAELMFGRPIRVRLSAIVPSEEVGFDPNISSTKEGKKINRERKLNVQDQILVRDYSDPNKKRWKRACISRVIGPRTYLCTLKDGRVWRRHLNQIHSGFSFQTDQADQLELGTAGIWDMMDEVRPELPGQVEQGSAGEGEEQIEPRRSSRVSRPPRRLDL